MPRRKSKDKFRGIPAWKKAKLADEHRVDQPTECCASSAISGHEISEPDANNSCEMEENQPLTASEKKIMSSEEVYDDKTTAMEGDEEFDTTSNPSKPYFDEDPGYRFFHLSNVHQVFQEGHKCKNAKILFVEDQAKRYGQSALFCIQCSKCKKKTYLPTSKSSGNSWDPNDATDINRRLVYAASETGIGREGMSTICSILNMPQPMSSQSWNSHTNVLYDAHKQVIEKHLTSTRQKLREKLKKDNPDLLDDDVVDIAVTYDGTWSKRGHTASYGFGFVISVETGQVIDYGFRSKICTSCNKQKADKDSDEYKEWYDKHKQYCTKNFDGSSGNMEVSIAEELWKRSLDFRMRYKYMVCDGDSKAYVAVWDVYGCCETCRKYERMDRKSKEYEKWIESNNYKKWKKEHEEDSVLCNRVRKLDCIGHVQKRIGTALRELKRKSTGKLQDGKSIGGKGHRLSDKTIDKLQEYYGKAIRRNVTKNTKSETEINKAIKNMQDAILAVLYHCVLLPDSKKRHKFCPKHADSWCHYARTQKEAEPKNHYLDPVFLDLLLPLFTRLSDRSLLLRCLPGYSQNQNESLNGIVWSKAPKHKYKGPKAIEVAGISAILQFDSGAKARQEVMKLANIPPGRFTEEAGATKDKKRIVCSKRKASLVEKKKRIAQRQAKLVREMEAREKEGGLSYSSGAFNEEALPGPKLAKRPKRKKK